MSCFAPIPDELDFLRTFPGGGGWAFLRGNQHAPRGHKLPSFCEDIGIRRMDIFWVENEQITERHQKMFLNLNSGRGKRKTTNCFYNAMDIRSIEELRDLTDGEKRELFVDTLSSLTADFGGMLVAEEEQLTIVDAHLGQSQKIRFYCGELSCISDAKLGVYISENAYISTPLGLQQESIVEHPLLETAVKELVDSLLLDGLSYGDALNMVVEWGELTVTEAGAYKPEKPNHYYKVSDEVYYIFND